jgi:hypothetical protein
MSRGWKVESVRVSVGASREGLLRNYYVYEQNHGCIGPEAKCKRMVTALCFLFDKFQASSAGKVAGQKTGAVNLKVVRLRTIMTR